MAHTFNIVIVHRFAFMLNGLIFPHFMKFLLKMDASKRDTNFSCFLICDEDFFIIWREYLNFEWNSLKNRKYYELNMLQICILANSKLLFLSLFISEPDELKTIRINRNQFRYLHIHIWNPCIKFAFICSTFLGVIY